MAEKYLLFSLEDEQSKKLGEVISNSTCKKIASLLGEKELSETDIARELKIPVNTVEYNLKKLLQAGIIEKSKQFFWSVKGKKIDIYKIANKLIVISPKKSNIYSKLRGLVPVALILGIFTSFLAWYRSQPNFSQRLSDLAPASMESAKLSLPATNMAQSSVSTISWEWFLVGSLIAIIAFAIFNWKKL